MADAMRPAPENGPVAAGVLGDLAVVGPDDVALDCATERVGGETLERCAEKQPRLNDLRILTLPEGEITAEGRGTSHAAARAWPLLKAYATETSW